MHAFANFILQLSFQWCYTLTDSKFHIHYINRKLVSDITQFYAWLELEFLKHYNGLGPMTIALSPIKWLMQKHMTDYSTVCCIPSNSATHWLTQKHSFHHKVIGSSRNIEWNQQSNQDKSENEGIFQRQDILTFADHCINETAGVKVYH